MTACIAGCWSQKATELPQTIGAGVTPPLVGRAPEFTLMDQTGAAYGSVSLSGRFWITSFVDCNIAAIAEREVAKPLLTLQGQLDRLTYHDDIRLVTFLQNSGERTPVDLQRIIGPWNADSKRWKLLSGPNDLVQKLTRQFQGLPVSGAPDRVNQSSSFLVDAQGVVRGVYSLDSAAGQTELLKSLDQIVAERHPVPAEVLHPTWLDGRQQAQLQTKADVGVFCDFGFSDRIEESGIRFRNRIVDDVGKYYKAVHYDHGNGVTAADVDGDGLLDLYFSSQLGANGLWRNRGDGSFEDITDSAAVSVSKLVGVTASFADIDNDGDPDLFVTTVRGGNLLFANDGKGKFTDITETSGLGYVGHSSGAVFFDYDRDGLLDLFVCNVGVYTTDKVGAGGYYVGFPDAFAGHLKPEERNEQSRLYRNLGKHRFEDVSAGVQLEDVSWTGDASPVDWNRDGWPDLYVLNMQGHDQYYENIQGKHFKNRSLEVFPRTPWGSMGIKVLDLENDGDLDLLLTDMHSDMSEDIAPDLERAKSTMRWPPRFLQTGEFNPQPGRENIWGNALFRNRGDGTSEEVSLEYGVENYWPWGLSAGDLNADGYEDVFITSSMCYPFRYAVNSLLLNDRGKRFVASEFLLGVEPRREGRTATPWFELDCSGADSDHPDCKGRSGRAVVWSAVGTKSSVIFDVDNDGDLDIVTNECNDFPMVLLSSLAEKKPALRYLKVRLVGTTSNRDGLGALVTVQTPDGTLTKVHDGVTGYLSHGIIPLYFGLGDAETIQQVTVTWPNGKQQTIAQPVTMNATLVVTEE